MKTAYSKEGSCKTEDAPGSARFRNGSTFAAERVNHNHLKKAQKNWHEAGPALDNVMWQAEVPPNKPLTGKPHSCGDQPDPHGYSFATRRRWCSAHHSSDRQRGRRPGSASDHRSVSIRAFTDDRARAAITTRIEHVMERGRIADLTSAGTANVTLHGPNGATVNSHGLQPLAPLRRFPCAASSAPLPHPPRTLGMNPRFKTSR